MPFTSPKVCFVSGLLGAALVFGACNYAQNVRLLTAGSLERDNFVDTIPFEYDKDLIVVEARLHNQDERREFILDTGAFESKVEIELAEDLDLPTKATKTNPTAQGITEEIEITQLPRVTLGETPFANISGGKLRYGAQSASRCVAPHGIIGANLMKLAHWKIDYHSQELQVSDTPFDVRDDSSFVLGFDTPLLSGTPEIEVEVGGRTVSGVLFDVGYNGGLVLPDRLADSFPSEHEQTYWDRSTSGIFGTSTDTLTAKLLDVSLGGYDVQIPVEFSSLDKALLGNDVLEHFDVTLDYDAKHIGLHPRSDVHVDPPYAFIPGVLSDSLWVVTRASAALPVALGDTLRSINDQNPVDLYSSFCDYFLNVNALLDADSLSISQRDGSISTITGERLTLVRSSSLPN
jgi:predicted aspartyl protease